MIRITSLLALPCLSACLFFTTVIPSFAEPADVVKLRSDRERLIKVVLGLEADFSATIKDYGILQADYQKLLAQPVIPDQRDEVATLKKALSGAVAKLRKMQTLEKDTRKSSVAELAQLKETLHGDLAALRKELGIDRRSLRLARTQLEELRTIQIETRKVEEMLRTETIGRSDLQASLQTLRGERDALLLRVKENMDLLAKSEDGRKKAEARVAQLEKSTSDLQADLKKRSAEIADLKKKAANNERLQMTITRLEADKKIASADLTKLREELAQLQGTIKANEKVSATKLTLFKKQGTELAQLKTDLAAKVQMVASMAQLKADLGTNKNLLTARDAEVKKLTGTAAILQKEKAALATQLSQSAVALKKAQTSLAAKEKEAAVATKLAQDLKKTKADLAVQTKAAATAATLEKEKASLTATLAARSAEDKKFRLEAAKRLEEIFAKNKEELARLAKEQSEKSKAATLKIAALEKDKTKLQNELSKRETELRIARAEAADQSKLTSAVAKIEKEKDAIIAQLATREADLKKVRMDLGKLHLKSEVTTKQMQALKIRFAKVDPVRYALGAADVRDQQQRVLRDVKEVLAMFPSASFEIVGHTCDLGSQEGNLKLSKERAGSLATFLGENGIAPDLLKARGIADAEPLVPNTNEANRRRNRRVEIHILD